VDVEWFFGVKGAARLRGLKTRLDPENLFNHALPRLKAC
jgi:FAD/FMN-containing dehydrogenase